MDIKLKKLLIACDHAGLPLKQDLLKKHPGLPWEDLGVHSEESVDYPDAAKKLCRELIRLQNDSDSDSYRGVLICGSGQGMAITANRYRQIRAALCFNPEFAMLAREHNNANVLCLGSRTMDWDLAEESLRVFVAAPFGGGRHEMRVQKLGGDL